MISTIETKQAQLRDGFYQTGSGSTKILLLGSCRTMAYLNYLKRWNDMSGNYLTIYRIDPHDFHWNAGGDLVDMDAAIRAQESNPRVLEVLRECRIFVHEHLESFGMFNTASNSVQTIYQHGLVPDIDVCLPNFHDRFVLFNEQLQFDEALRNAVRGPLDTWKLVMRGNGLTALSKFYDVCRLSSFPELADEMRANWTKRRFFWTGNHVSKHFTLFLMRQLNERFLELPLTDAFWAGASTEDQFATPCTAVTQYDVDAYGLTWPDTPIETLKL